MHSHSLGLSTLRRARASLFRSSSSRLRRLHSSPIAASLSAQSSVDSASQHTQESASTSSSSSTVNAAEIAHFSRLSSLWWDEHGEFQMLHKMNPVRMQFIREKLLEIAYEDSFDASIDETNALNGLNVLDVGCGGGLLSETLTRLGAHTLGIDASPSNIAIASLHASADPALGFTPSLSLPTSVSSPELSLHQTVVRTERREGKSKGTLTYEHTSVEDLLARRGPGAFDVVCSMEVLEHVDNPRAFLSSCAQLVKPGGHLFLSTIARTPLAYLLTIFAAEQLLRLVAPGTHTYGKYVNPDELVEFFAEDPALAELSGTGARPWIRQVRSGAAGLKRTEAEVRGMVYVPWSGKWILAPRGDRWAEGCNYVFWVRRPAE